jgi:hypothetical protein
VTNESPKIQNEKQTVTHHWEWAVLLGFMAVQAAFVFGLRADFLTDWDSYLYTYGGMKLQPVSLAGGRWLFTAILNVVWRTANEVKLIQPDNAWVIFSYAMMAIAVVNAGLFYALAKRWTGREPAIAATAIFVSSPMIGLYGSAVMTETPAMFMLLASLLTLTKKPSSLWRAAIAGIVFGAGCTIREPLLMLAVLPMGIIFYDAKRKWWWVGNVLVFIVTMAAVIGASLIIVWKYGGNWQAIYAGWSAGMARERMQIGHTLWKMLLRNILCILLWAAVFSPIVVLAAYGQLKAMWEKRSSWGLAMMAALGLYAAAQVMNHSLVFNPRFFIFMGALLCVPAGMTILRWLPVKVRNPFLAAVAVILAQAVLISIFWGSLDSFYFEKSRNANETYQTLSEVPYQALIVPGRLTPAVDLYKKIHKTDWDIVYAGWDFSDKDLAKAIEDAKASGKTVFIVEEKYWAEKTWRQTQYIATEDVWNRYHPRPSTVAHFYKLEFPKKKTTKDFIHKAWDFLNS